jgi:putative salt-induced outer membrane protein YdiY
MFQLHCMPVLRLHRLHRLHLLRLALALIVATTLASRPASAQAPAPPPPPPGWTGSVGAGMALTSGNTDTSSVNVGYDVLRDHGTDILFKSTGVYLRGSNDGVSNVDRSGADARLEYKLSPRLSVFALTTYARDSFKDIDYLLAPTAGLSYKVVATERTEWTTDGSAGLVFEKNTGFGLKTDGALIAGEKLAHAFNDTTRFVHAASALWKMREFGDAFYTLSAGVITTVATHLDLKVEFLNTYKNRPTDPLLKKSDQSLVLSVVYRY